MNTAHVLSWRKKDKKNLVRNLKQSPLKIGILGCGSFVKRRMLPALATIDKINVVCIQKRKLSAAKDLAAAFNIPSAVSTRDELLLHPEVEAVLIATPNHLHEEDAIACAQHCKPTLCEKPLATSATSVRRMQQAFSQSQTPLYVGHSLRFKPCLQQAKNMLQTKKLGDLVSLHARFNIPIPKENWRHQTCYGGGALQEIGVHLIDFVRFVSGEEIVSVSAMANASYIYGEKEADQQMFVTCRLTNGAMATIECSLMPPFYNGFEIIGSSSRLVSHYSLRQTQAHEIGERFYRVAKDGSETSMQFPVNNIYADELIHFAESIAGATSSTIISTNEALQNQKVIDAAYQSVAQKKIVSIRVC